MVHRTAGTPVVGPAAVPVVGPGVDLEVVARTVRPRDPAAGSTAPAEVDLGDHRAAGPAVGQMVHQMVRRRSRVRPTTVCSARRVRRRPSLARSSRAAHRRPSRPRGGRRAGPPRRRGRTSTASSAGCSGRSPNPPHVRPAAGATPVRAHDSPANFTHRVLFRTQRLAGCDTPGPQSCDPLLSSSLLHSSPRVLSGGILCRL